MLDNVFLRNGGGHDGCMRTRNKRAGLRHANRPQRPSESCASSLRLDRDDIDFEGRECDKGMPVERVQLLLGHGKIDTTLGYAMVDQNNVRESHRRFIS